MVFELSTPVHSWKRLSFAEAGGLHLSSESGQIVSKCGPKITDLQLLN